VSSRFGTKGHALQDEVQELDVQVLELDVEVWAGGREILRIDARS
jgi:hypothetical protein